MIIFSYALSILEFMNYALFLVLVAKFAIPRIDEKKVVAIIIYSLLYLIIFTRFADFYYLKVMLVFLIQLALALCLFHERKTIILTWFLISWFISNAVIALLYIGINQFMAIGGLETFKLLILMLLVSIWFALSEKKQETANDVLKNKVPKAVYFNIILTCVFCCLIILTVVLFKRYTIPFFEMFFIIISILTFIITIYTGLELVHHADLKCYYLNKSEMLENSMELQERYFADIYERYEQIRSINHDLNAHFTCIDKLCKEEKYLELRAYIENLKSLSHTKYDVVYCADPYISAVLYHLYDQIEKQNIQFEFIYLIPKDMELTPIERSSLFYNLLSNGIEACEHLETKEVKLVVDYTGTTMIITMKNTVSEDFSLDDLKGHKTTKASTVQHGIGLVNIEHIVNSYEGSINYQLHQSMLDTTILLYNCI